MYASVSHDLYLIYSAAVFIGTAGVSFRAADTIYPYICAGADFISGSPFAEGGLIVRKGRFVFDLGAGYNILYASNLFPYGYVIAGMGYCF